jgi:hypothetical protein
MDKFLELDFFKFQPPKMVFVGTDDYDALAVGNAIKKQNVEECFALALHFIIIGVGNKNYGSIIIGDTTYDVKQLCLQNNIILGVPPSTRLEANVLTFKRLVRAFGLNLRNYLAGNDLDTFLMRKYSAVKGVIIYSGMEYNECTAEEEKTLLEAYTNLDTEKGTSFERRARQVFNAKRNKILYNL